MPAMLDDPAAPPIQRVSGSPPYPVPFDPLPENIIPRQVTLRDRTTTATLVPFSSPNQVPPHLLAYLCELLNREIEKGDTYPMMDGMALSYFAPYWFANFAAIMVVGDIQSPEEIAQMEQDGADWAKKCLGSFYIKPNYPGRSSHVCNGGFLVTDAARNRGVGRLMGEGYLEWAPKLGYTYSVFNLVYETNVASLKIWDALGFKRIGRVKGCGNLKSYPDEYVDAIIFGRELGGDNDEYQTEERFDKIRFYLKTGTYPNGSDRAEKSRLRSAATHYRLIPGTSETGDDEKLMLKGKEVISDPHKQYEIARNMHALSHGGINKTTAGIADKYHWVRIKETVSAAIRNCSECKDSTKSLPTSTTRERISSTRRSTAAPSSTTPTGSQDRRATVAAAADSAQDTISGASPLQQPPQQHVPAAPMQYGDGSPVNYEDMPVDPQIMQGMQQWDANDDAQRWKQQHNAMEVDGGYQRADHHSTEHRQDESEHDEIGARLVEELQARIMSDSRLTGSGEDRQGGS